MNPANTDKQNAVLILKDTLNNLKNCRIEPDSNLFAYKAVENAIFNLKRIIDLIEQWTYMRNITKSVTR